ncbi:MAG: primosomal protein N' [Mariprofundaceae bacterium]|nr:primosomal protein N' [Mariprofundaceae bacterium]
MNYVDVAVFAPLHGTYTYQWPETLGEPEPGLRIRVPFGNGWRNGVVLLAHNNAPEQPGRPVDDRLELSPSCSPSYLAWIERASRYYLAPFGELLETALAWGGTDETRKFRLLDSEKLASSDPELAALFTTRRALSLKTVRQRASGPAVQMRLLYCVDAGGLEEVLSKRDDPPISSGGSAIKLRPAQQKALDAILASSDRFESHLLFGATGSGKTEVYLRAAEKIVRQGRQALILVPEIALTPMWLSRLQFRFGRIGVWHSAMGADDRRAVLERLDSLDVLIGTRSALFLPLPKPGIIVVDEEHDGSFKQQDGVAYSARDMALLLGQEMKVPVVLGSATPSLESWRQVKGGTMGLLELPERISPHAPMTPEVIDLRDSGEVLSGRLLAALEETRAKGQQSILFLNRRGYSPALQCTACGDVPKCKACSLNMTLHRRARQLRCHACGWVQPVPRHCSSCGEDSLLPLGAGTEKLEELLAEKLPELRFARFDRDAITTNKGLIETLKSFTDGEIDCLIGTQMLVKGHHFPNVTLVGVVNADMGLSLPDFRAGERWWQQMTQVTGRAGRGEHPGRIIIQTNSPDAPWFERIGDESAAEVMNEELQLREQLNYPPYARWVRIVFSSVQRDRAEAAAERMAAHIERWGAVTFSGPMACSVERLSGRYRIEILLRDPERKTLPWKLMPLLQKLSIPSGVRRKVDVDPIDMM